jgi:hypothetical protein
MSTDEKNTTENDSSIYYVLGAVVLVAAIAGFFLLRPKTPAADTTTPVASAPAVEPTPGPITKFDCGKMYYNQKIGFEQFYISLEGVDTLTTGMETCNVTVSVKTKTVATASANGSLSEEPTRGGATFRCTTDAIDMARGVPTHIETVVTNPNKQTVTCKQDFIFP